MIPLCHHYHESPFLSLSLSTFSLYLLFNPSLALHVHSRKISKQEMCIFSSPSKLSSYSSLILAAATANAKPARGFRVHYRRSRLSRRRELSREAKNKMKLNDSEKEMKMKNLKLYIENESIIQENEKLRMKAALLHQENQALLSELKKHFL